MENITEEERQSPVPHGVYFLPEAVEKNPISPGTQGRPSFKKW